MFAHNFSVVFVNRHNRTLFCTVSISKELYKVIDGTSGRQVIGRNTYLSVIVELLESPPQYQQIILSIKLFWIRLFNNCLWFPKSFLNTFVLGISLISLREPNQSI